MKTRIKLLALVLITTAFSGCTAISLERHTANQAMTGADMRYQIVLDAVAKIISNPGDLPSLGTATDGTAVVTDSVAYDAKTALVALKGFAGETLTGSPMRSPNLSWTIDPVHTPEQIRAAQEACKWAITRTAPVDPYATQLLKDFQVYNYLNCLTDGCAGWFGFGCKASVPRNCCYVAHHCNTYVWVLPEGMKGLSEFTLILTDIATIDPSSLHGTATVSIYRRPDPPANLDKVITTQNIPYRLNDVGQVQLMSAVVCYGDPNCISVPFVAACPPFRLRGGVAEAHATTAEEEVGAPQSVGAMQAEAMPVMTNRSFQSSSPYAAFNFRSQQTQSQSQSQFYQALSVPPQPSTSRCGSPCSRTTPQPPCPAEMIPTPAPLR